MYAIFYIFSDLGEFVEGLQRLHCLQSSDVKTLFSLPFARSLLLFVSILFILCFCGGGRDRLPQRCLRLCPLFSLLARSTVISPRSCGLSPSLLCRLYLNITDNRLYDCQGRPRPLHVCRPPGPSFFLLTLVSAPLLHFLGFFSFCHSYPEHCLVFSFFLYYLDRSILGCLLERLREFRRRSLPLFEVAFSLLSVFEEHLFRTRRSRAPSPRGHSAAWW